MNENVGAKDAHEHPAASTGSGGSSAGLIEEMDAQVQILHALEYPILRIGPDNVIRFMNNAFLEFAEDPATTEHRANHTVAETRAAAAELRERLTGTDFLAYLSEGEHDRFEALKTAARESYSSSEAVFRIGVRDEFTFFGKAGGKIPVRISMTFSRKYDAFQISITDISRLRAAQAELEAASADLERRVEERTQELERANEEIRFQTQAMRDMSTPVIGLWSGVILVPMIGSMDTDRSHQLSMRLLEEVSRQDARVVILDVTGLVGLDTSVARHILDTVAAARLLGAHAILTGISPEMAQTLTQLGVNFADLATRGTLENGVREAFQYIDRRMT